MDKDDVLFFAGLGVLTMIIVISAVLVGCYFEMKAFNRHSTTKASFADAIFCELRIVAD